jgi:hypothetical protein
MARAKFMHCPPSFRFPPLREGNRAGGWFPRFARGTVHGGFAFAPLREGNRAWGWFALLREGNRVGGRPAAGGELCMGLVLPALRGEPRMAYSCGSPCLPHYTTVFGRTGSEAEFAILLQVPPRAWGNPTAVPLAKQGEPNGGGLQKVSCNETACRRGLSNAHVLVKFRLTIGQ